MKKQQLRLTQHFRSTFYSTHVMKKLKNMKHRLHKSLQKYHRLT